jgi:hypothetical protein
VNKFQGAKIINSFLLPLPKSLPQGGGTYSIGLHIIAPLLSWEKGLGDEALNQRQWIIFDVLWAMGGARKEVRGSKDHLGVRGGFKMENKST